MATALLTLDELLTELGITRSTWDNWRARRVTPPALKLPNGKLRFRRADLDAWLEDRAA
jgi:predicted DNA-binding transcriptional regulator AlpA